MGDGAFYDASARMPFSNGGQYNTPSQDHFRFPSSGQLQPKQDEYLHSTSGETLSSSGASHFLNISGANPLFSQDRLFLNSYSQSSVSPLGFTPINRDAETARPSHSHQDQDRRLSRTGSVKLETQYPEAKDDEDSQDSKKSGFWDSQDNGTDLNLHDNIDSEQLGI